MSLRRPPSLAIVSCPTDYHVQIGISRLSLQNVVEYANLPIIDLSQMDRPNGREKLAVQVRNAMTTEGFFYVINHGFSSTQVSVMIEAL